MFNGSYGHTITNTVNTMKTLTYRSMLLSAAFLLVMGVQGAEPVRVRSEAAKRTQQEKALDRALNRHLFFPLDTREDMTGDVYVSFVIDKEGRVVVLDCHSENQRLRDHVMRKLARIDIGDNQDGVWRTTHLRIHFRPEHTQG